MTLKDVLPPSLKKKKRKKKKKKIKEIPNTPINNIHSKNYDIEQYKDALVFVSVSQQGGTQSVNCSIDAYCYADVFSHAGKIQLGRVLTFFMFDVKTQKMNCVCTLFYCWVC